MAADHQVDIWNLKLSRNLKCVIFLFVRFLTNLFSDLHIFVITCVTDCNQNVDPFHFETFGFFTNATNFVENLNSIRTGDVLENELKFHSFINLKKKKKNQLIILPMFLVLDNR